MSDEQKSDKEVAYYSAIVNGWLTTRLEHDKSVLALSSGGVALLVSLLFTQDAITPLIFLLFCIASIAFLVAITAVVVILKRNARHLIGVINESEMNDPILQFLDGVASYAFVVGVLFTLVIGLGIGISAIQIDDKVDKMSDKDSVKTMIETGKGTIKKSWDGIADVRPVQGNGNSKSGQNDTGSKQGDQQGAQGSSQNEGKK